VNNNRFDPNYFDPDASSNNIVVGETFITVRGEDRRRKKALTTNKRRKKHRRASKDIFK